MPRRTTTHSARRPRAATTRAGAFIRDEIDSERASGRVKSRKQAIAIGLSKARRAGVAVPPPRPGQTSPETRHKAGRDLEVGQGRGGRRTRTAATRTRRSGKASGSGTTSGTRPRTGSMGASSRSMGASGRSIGASGRSTGASGRSTGASGRSTRARTKRSASGSQRGRTRGATSTRRTPRTRGSGDGLTLPSGGAERGRVGSTPVSRTGHTLIRGHH